MLLAPIPWAKRIWALPFLTVLDPSERYNKDRGRRHKTIADWARQMVRQLRRSHGKAWRCWLPTRSIVLVGDDAYSVLDFLDSCIRMKNPVTVVTRLRLDAALYEPAPERKVGQMGRPRVVGTCLRTLKELCKDEKAAWQRVIVPRWYSRENREVEIISTSCVWRHPGVTPVPIRYVLIRDPEGKFDTQALLSTNLSHAGSAVNKSVIGPRADSLLVRETLTQQAVEAMADGGNLPGGQNPPGSRDTAPARLAV